MNKSNQEKEKRISIFKDTLNCIETNQKIKTKAEKSKTNTIFYEKDCKFKEKIKNKEKAKIIVINERSLRAAKQFSEDVAVLNFASAKFVGGGVVNGSKTQEECLCRCSSLHHALSRKDLFNSFYEQHQRENDFLYSDRMIYFPDVIVFKEDIDFPIIQTEKDWTFVNIISAAAPNLREQEDIDRNKITNIFKKRIRKILDIAIENKNKNIILGAFGCGAFRNDPVLVAHVFRDILVQEDYLYYFEHVIFAAYCLPDTNMTNFEVFQKILKDN